MATVSEPETPAETSTSWPANPAPLGLSAFGLTTLVLSFINSGLVGVPPASYPVVLGMAVGFGGLGQIFAGLWEFRTGNVFGAVAFTSYGGFWLSFYFLVQFNVGQLAPGSVNSLLALYLIAWGVLTAMFFLCTFTSPRALSLLFLLLTLTFIFLGIGQDNASTTVIHIGGILGIITAANALYLACAFIMEHTYGRPVLPVGAPS